LFDLPGSNFRKGRVSELSLAGLSERIGRELGVSDWRSAKGGSTPSRPAPAIASGFMSMWNAPSGKLTPPSSRKAGVVSKTEAALVSCAFRSHTRRTRVGKPRHKRAYKPAVNSDQLMMYAVNCTWEFVEPGVRGNCSRRAICTLRWPAVDLDSARKPTRAPR
jgi:hypothetical protein